MADGKLDVRVDRCAKENLIRYRVSRRERLEFEWALQLLHGAGLQINADFGVRRKTINQTTFYMKALAKRPHNAPVVWLFFCAGERRGRTTVIVLGCEGMCVMRLRFCRENVYRTMATRASRIHPFFD